MDGTIKLIQSVAVAHANVPDSQMMEDLLQGNQARLWGVSAYAGQEDKLTAEHVPQAKDFAQKKGGRHRLLTTVSRNHLSVGGK